MAEAKIFELNNGTMQVKVSNYGCTITSLFVPDKDGEFTKSIAYQRSNRFCISTVNACSLIFFLCLRCEGKLADVVLGFDTLEPYQVSGVFIPNSIHFSFSAIIMIWLFFLHRNWIGACYMKMRISCSFFWGLFYVWFSWFGCFNSVCAERCCSVFRVHCGSGCKQDQRWEVHPRWNWVLIAS